MAHYPTGPLASWLDEDADDAELGQYATNLSVEHARAVLLCHLENRTMRLRRGDMADVRQELSRHIVETAAEGRLAELQELTALAADLSETSDV